MFKDEFHAWPSGPVIPSVYDEFVQFQSGEMLPIAGDKSDRTTPEMDAVLDFVFEKTKEMDTIDIIKKSHEPSGPWEKAYDENDINHRQVISKQSMYEYYKGKQLFD